MSPGELEALFARFRQHGDLEALAAVFDATGPRLLAIARHLVADEASAEDLVQATFLAAIETAARFDERRDLEAWLVGILTNKAKEHRAQERRRIDPERLVERACEDPVEAARAREFVEALDRTLAGVPSAYRQVLSIHLADGRTPDEIAQELGRPGATVRVQLMRGLQHLRRLLPAGLALGGAAAVVAPRGLAVVRATVLTSAKGYVPVGAVSATAATAGTILGGLVMKKTITAGVIVLIALLLGFALMREERPRTEARDPVVGAVAIEAPPPSADAPVDPGAQIVDPQPERAALTTEEPYGALDVRVVWHDDQPVAGVFIGASSDDDPRPRQVQIEGTTDAEGRFRIARIHEGTVRVGLAITRTGATVAVERGKTAELLLRVPQNTDVRGRVVDRRRKPVAGASLFVGPGFGEDGLMLVARSTSDGSFLIRSVDPLYAVIATADGHAPSVPVAVGASRRDEGNVRELELILEDGGARLRVTVLHPDGSPATGEWVEAVAPGLRRNDPRRGFWLLTDAQGEVMFDGLPAGKIDLVLSPNDAPCTRRSIEIESTTPNAVVIQLQAGAFVSGTITHADGTPWAHFAAVQADIGRDGPDVFDRAVHSACFRYALTDATGHYRLGPLPAGKLSLEANSTDATRKQRLAREARTVEALDGQEITWDVVLEAPHLIRGRVVDADGVPAVGWSVAGRPLAGNGSLRGTATDARGRFELGPCVDGPHAIWTNPPAGQTGRGVQLDSVLPDSPDVELLVTGVESATHGSSRVVGRVVEADGMPAVDYRVYLHRQGAQGRDSSTVFEDGSFQIGRLVPGTYSISVSRSGEEPLSLLEALVLEDGATIDVGELRLPAYGTFVLHARRSDGVPVEAKFVKLLDGSGSTRIIDRTSDGAFRSIGIPAGSYRLITTLNNAFAPELNVEIRADERTEIELSCEPGTSTVLDFRLPEGATMPERFRAEVRRGAEVMRTYDGPPLGPPSGPADKLWMYFAIPTGTYSWSASAGEGWIGEGTFECKGDGARIELELHAR